MTLTERLAAAHQESVALYLRRQMLEQQRQQLAAQAAQIDQRLISLDGTIETLTALIADALIADAQKADIPKADAGG